MENLLPLLWLLSAHFVADFVLQTDWMARNKSSDWDALANHVAVYSFTMTVGFLTIAFTTVTSDWGTLMVFFWLTAITHFATDAVTSRINKRLWDAGRVHDFFVGVGADQLIHAWTLAATYALLTGGL